MKFCQTIALIAIWSAATVGAVLVHEPGIYVAAVAGTAAWAVAVCNGF